MASKSKIQEKQDARAIKTYREIIDGRSKVAFYEKPAAPAQRNRVGGAGDQEGLAGEYARLLRIMMPGMLAELSGLSDPRDKNKTTHSLPTLILYGILMFLSQTESRRAANREMGGSKLAGLMEELAPGYVSMPHADTLGRLLEGLDDAEKLEERYSAVLSGFVKSEAFRRINPGRFLVAADGSGKFSRRYCWDSRALSRNAGDPDKELYFMYVMESVLILDNGMVLPLLTETLENGGALDDAGKQDCETKAFKRLSGRLAKLLGKGCVTIILDGLYASGPILSICENYGWEYMITLKKDSLASVWDDFNGLKKIEHENTLYAQYGGRGQEYRWSNGIEYEYGGNHRRLRLNLVTCAETWRDERPRKGGGPRMEKTEYAWLSSVKLSSKNVFDLCLKARRRWRIENHFHVAKNDGYGFEHCFSYNWNAMKGFHSLMKFANMINVIILHSQYMLGYVASEGKKGAIKKAWRYLFVVYIAAEPVESIVSEKKLRQHRKRNRYSEIKLCTAG